MGEGCAGYRRFRRVAEGSSSDHGGRRLRLAAEPMPRCLRRHRKRHPGRHGRSLHSPDYDFNDQIIPVGVAYWVNLVRRILPEGAG